LDYIPEDDIFGELEEHHAVEVLERGLQNKSTHKNIGYDDFVNDTTNFIEDYFHNKKLSNTNNEIPIF
jgi:hypothetical protein